MQLIFLTEQFYIDYQHCYEIEQKQDRPYTQVFIKCKGLCFAIPFRSSISHKYAFWTDKKNKCGIDYSKAVVIEDDGYINTTDKPYIRPNEFRALRGKESIIARELEEYIKKYIAAKQFPNRTENIRLLKYSTLQYFEKYII